MSELIEAAKAGDAARARQILVGLSRGGLGGQRGRRNAADGGPLPRTSGSGGRNRRRRRRGGWGARRLRGGGARPRRVPPCRARQPGRGQSYAYDGWTPLHLAAFFGHREAAERLLGAGAALNATSTNSMQQYAAPRGGRRRPHRRRAAAHPARRRGQCQGLGRHTPLHIAAENGNAAVVESLLEHGADPHAVDAEDKTPLSRAAARNHAAIVDLINAGA